MYGIRGLEHLDLKPNLQEAGRLGERGQQAVVQCGRQRRLADATHARQADDVRLPCLQQRRLL